MVPIKSYRSEEYNWNFNTTKGLFIRWGKTLEDNPDYSPVGPELMDIEISTSCHGINNSPCKWCYKSNNPAGIYMSVETYKTILDKLPANITQIAFGIGDIDSNPDLEAILKLTRDRGIIPNITINGDRMTDYYYSILGKYCGAVAVSHYNNDKICGDAVAKLVAQTKIEENSLRQVNIHKLLAEETKQEVFELLDRINNSEQYTGLNAIVFLLVKPKGNRNTFTLPRDTSIFKDIITKSIEKKVQIGFDSCSAPLVAYNNTDRINIDSVEFCEAGLFSLYCNVKGKVFPCSFMEEHGNWTEGINLLEPNIDFDKDVWHGKKLKAWRAQLLSSTNSCTHCKLSGSCRSCPGYDITPCKGENK